MTELTEVSVYVNPVIVAICLLLGKMIKSASFMKKIPNDAIPFILMALSIGASFIIMGVNGDALCSGIFSSAAAVGIHQQGKQGFKPTTSIVDDLGLITDKSSTDEDESEEDAKG